MTLPCLLPSAQEDIILLRELHVNHYQFSLSWPRILPTGIRGELGPLWAMLLCGDTVSPGKGDH